MADAGWLGDRLDRSEPGRGRVGRRLQAFRGQGQASVGIASVETGSLGGGGQDEEDSRDGSPLGRTGWAGRSGWISGARMGWMTVVGWVATLSSADFVNVARNPGLALHLGLLAETPPAWSTTNSVSHLRHGIGHLPAIGPSSRGASLPADQSDVPYGTSHWSRGRVDPVRPSFGFFRSFRQKFLGACPFCPPTPGFF